MNQTTSNIKRIECYTSMFAFFLFDLRDLVQYNVIGMGSAEVTVMLVVLVDAVFLLQYRSNRTDLRTKIKVQYATTTEE